MTEENGDIILKRPTLQNTWEKIVLTWEEIAALKRVARAQLEIEEKRRREENRRW